MNDVAAAVGFVNRSARPTITGLVDYLAERQLLIVVDNCEHLLSGCATLVRTLLRAVPGLKILATSRQPFAVEGEFIRPVLPLSVPGSDTPMTAEVLKTFDAVELLVQRAAAVMQGFEVTIDNSAAVVRLCRRLDGIPLAIELAAGRLRSLSLQQVIDRLDKCYRLLVGGSRTALPRQRTLQATMDWSFDLCSVSEQTLWNRLSVFAGGFDLEAAEYVCSGAGIEPDTIIDLVAELVDKSILICEQHGNQAWYRMLETVRRYGEDNLRAGGEYRGWRHRHRDWYRALVKQAESQWLHPDQARWCARLRLELANIRAAMEFCLSDPDEAMPALEIAASMWDYWHTAGELGEGRYWMNRVLELETDSPAERVKALWVSGRLALMQGDVSAALPMLDECRTVSNDLGDEPSLARLVQFSALSTVFRGEFADAVAILEESRDRFRALRDPNGEWLAMLYLALTESILGHDRRAAACGIELLEMSEQRGLICAKFESAVKLGAHLTLAEIVDFALSDKVAIPKRAKEEHHDGMGALTRREREIAMLIARGRTNKEIAATLVIATRTAEGHRSRPHGLERNHPPQS